MKQGSLRVGMLTAFAFILAPAAQAQMAVIDSGAITQLLAQVKLLQQELQTVKSNLLQAQQTYQSMTGSRGMQNLLSGTQYNYLPTSWSQVQSAMAGGGAYGALAANIQSVITANTVLSPASLATMSPAMRGTIVAQRQNTALLQALTQQALSTTSDRFASLQLLINSIGTATDPKAILDLQGRIGAEQAMLQTDASKLQTLYQAAQAQEAARRAQAREQAIADAGTLRQLPAMGL